MTNEPNESLKQIDLLTKPFLLPDDVLKEVSNILLKEIQKGLSKKKHDNAVIKMFPTYVRDVPNGTEHGKFLALDLGGTNFRVLLIDLDGDSFSMENKIYTIPEEIMLGSGEQLFDHIANCLAQFTEDQSIKSLRLPLGFTFSFPCRQEGLTCARLTRWTKGFKCSGVVGEDVVQLLRLAVLRRQDIDIDVVAVLNDTTGTLMSCAHKIRNCRVGVIVGTGTNACYMEEIDNVELYDGKERMPEQMIVNTEWGAFGDNRCLDLIRTDFDEAVDRLSLNPGSQLFEKMISGMYMGELVRQVLVHACDKNLLFNGVSSEKLERPYAFETKYISKIESENSEKDNFSTVRQVLTNKMELKNVSTTDCENVKLICERVSTRAAFLVSAAVATLINKMKRNFTTVGVDGSVYRYHPHFHSLMKRKIEDLTDKAYKFDLMLSEDGSGRGAALVAAVAARQKEERSETI